MFSIALRQADHTRKYRVSASHVSGWDLTLLEDLRPTRQVHYDDWHRVERAVATLELEVKELTAKGWFVDPSPASA
jgi:hypothetical protein